MSLYRKYRPQTFEDVVGQEHIAQTLRNAISGERWAHAYLFCGPRGTGKTTSARLLAKCLNCAEGPTPTPCNKCDFCMRVRDNQAVMDLIEIDAASNTGVDNVRENIIEKVNVAPAQGRFRVYIIDEVHMLSVSSFNALLKTLEEPPAHAIFVLATTDAHKVPTTITSRCQRFDFRRVGPNDIMRRLQHVADGEGMELSGDAARLIARTADGALRDALTLLEQVAAFSPATINESDVRLVLGTVSQELLLQLVDAVATIDAAEALRQIERATDEGVSFLQLTRDLTNYCREVLLLTVGFESNGTLVEAEKQRQHEHSRQMGRARLMNCVEMLRAAEKEMRQSTDHRLLLELTLVRAAGDAGEARGGVAVAPASVPPRPAAAQTVPPAAQPTWRQTPRAALVEPRASEPRIPERVAPTPGVNRFTAPPEPLPEAVIAASGHVTSHHALSNGTAPSVEAVTNEVVAHAAEVALATEVGSTDLAPLTGEAKAGELARAIAEGESEAAHSGTKVEAVETQPTVEATEPAGKKKGRRIHNLDEFVELWGAVLTRIKRKIGVSAVAYLHDAWPVAMDDKDATLEFKKEFHFAKACEAATRLPFEQVLNECMATPRRLRFQLAKAPVKPPPAPEPEPAGGEDDEDEDNVLQLAQDLFAAEVVGRSGGG